MNILLVASDNSVSSGAFNSMVVLAKKLIDDNNNVLIIIPNKGTGTDLLNEFNIPYKMIRSYSWIINNDKNSLFKYAKVILKILLNIPAYFIYKKTIKENDIQIIHINTSWTYVGALACKNNNAKLVWHIREFLEEDQNKKIFMKRKGYNLINKADRIICISKSIYQKYEKIFDKEKLVIVHNGIDVDKYLIKNHDIFVSKKVNLLFIGGVNEKKGVFDLCEAVGILKNKSNYNIELNIVGNYNVDAKEKIDYIQNKYNINCIHLLGIQKDTVKYYSKADITFMCSVSEAFGRVTVEGMLSGSLVIGARAAGTIEIIKEKQTGLLYEPNDIEDLANTIEYALNNKELMKKIATNGQREAMKNFDSNLNEKNILKVYKELIK